MPSARSEQRLERSHRRLAPIVTEDEFIQVDLELVAADTVMSPKKPLLEIANGPVRQRHYGLRALSQAGFAAVGCEARVGSQPLSTR